MKNILNKHQFWACLAMLSMFMAIVTGHQLVHAGPLPNRQMPGRERALFIG